MEGRVQAAASRSSCCLLRFIEVLVQVRFMHDFEDDQHFQVLLTKKLMKSGVFCVIPLSL